MEKTQQELLSEVLRPVARPRILEGLYTDDQHERMLDVIKAHGPWPTITSHHFDTVEELVATTTGVVPEGLNLTLDDIATAHFRGFFGQNSVPISASSRTASTTVASSISSATTGAPNTPVPP